MRRRRLRTHRNEAPSGLSGLAGVRGEACIGGKLVGGQVAGAILIRFGQYLGRAELARPREAHQVPTVLAGGGIVADAGGEVRDADDNWNENSHERADISPFVSASAGPARPCGVARRRAKSSSCVGRCSGAGRESVRGALLSSVSRCRAGVAIEEGKRVGVVNVGEDRRGPRPEAFEQARQLVCQLAQTILPTPARRRKAAQARPRRRHAQARARHLQRHEEPKVLHRYDQAGAGRVGPTHRSRPRPPGSRNPVLKGTVSHAVSARGRVHLDRPVVID